VLIHLNIFTKTICFPDFTVDRNGYVIVYIDGACPGNGNQGARGGIGVWFGNNHPL
jgi:ribonuclease HI